MGNILRINNALEGMAEKIQAHEANLVTLENELQNARSEAERPFPKEDELREKTARLNQLNRELDNPRRKPDEQSQDDDEDGDGQDLDDGDTPAREPFDQSMTEGGKPSIRQAIRNFTPPPPVPFGMEKNQQRRDAR